MSILIKDKALPKTCEECLFYGIDVESGCFLEKCYVIRRAGQDKPSWCPLVPVPPHGRLIDVDALMNLIREHSYPLTAHFNSTDYGMFTIGIQQAVDETPTIIEAEEEQG